MILKFKFKLICFYFTYTLCNMFSFYSDVLCIFEGTSQKPHNLVLEILEVPEVPEVPEKAPTASIWSTFYTNINIPMQNTPVPSNIKIFF